MFARRIPRGVLTAFAILGLTAAAAGCGGSAADTETLTFAQIPQEDSTSIATQNADIISALEKQLGVKVKLQEATSYAAVIEALRAGQVDIASLGPFSYVVAADGKAGVAPVGVPADAPDASPTYRSYAITKPGSGINSLADMAGKKICFVDPTSTSGYLFPSAGLMQAGIDPEKGVTPIFAGGHDASALAVAGGQCDAGFAFDTMVDEQLPKSGQLAEGALRVIWKSEDIPKSPTVVSTKLPQELQDKITRVFQQDVNRPGLVKLGICSDEADCTLPEDVKYGFVPVDDAKYDGIRKVCAVTESKSCVA
ncbi:phosphate/phosphite/phosphonate ABC transporter substrate-binding protein [Nocardia vermiculata]|uniref:Phosphate/phosphite/phosphonate ABC transporter substrate-binding protein n=1 Tax=Nocardia vermiculata TaxID=257274 RepID=A0A846Y2Z4_9NOCA|nr:phosphate/phosphite/phosphonate ABC transporter substrate-binding protein [Nocardia vermiculata]NKY50999.1 phosphate/phosphite/phosphonate ABC transporter substrate-binding protein [Nocardia vermiculata]